MSSLDVYLGCAYEIVGVEDNPDGSIKVFLNARYEGRYIIVDAPGAVAEIKRQWANPSVRMLLPKADVEGSPVYQEAA